MMRICIETDMAEMPKSCKENNNDYPPGRIEITHLD